MCCGGKRSKLKKAVEIGASYLRAGTDSFGITTEYIHKRARMEVCIKCDNSTWMSLSEYESYLGVNGIIEIIENIDCLEKLPPPPKNPHSKKRRRLVCMLCKCLLAVKAGREQNKCLLGKWEERGF